MVSDDTGSDGDAIAALYDRSIAEVFRYATRLTAGDRAWADEIVQDAYVAAMRHLRDGDDVELSVGFVITACRNRFLDDVRSTARRRRREERSVGRPQPGVDPADRVGHEATDAMRSLPAEQRAAMVLRYVDDLPVAEVARQLGRSVHATESLLARAKATLRTRLGGNRT